MVFCDGTVDPTNPKTVRASAGSIFHLPVVVGGTVLEIVRHLHHAGFTTVGTLARGGTDYVAFDWCRPVAVVLGNEAAGLSPEVTDGLDATVTVSLAGRAESLNVSIAAAVVCFEARRQRTAAGWAPRRSTPRHPRARWCRPYDARDGGDGHGGQGRWLSRHRS